MLDTPQGPVRMESKNALKNALSPLSDVMVLSFNTKQSRGVS